MNGPPNTYEAPGCQWHKTPLTKKIKRSDLPVEAPTKFELLINLKAAKQIGLRIPPNVSCPPDFPRVHEATATRCPGALAGKRYKHFTVGVCRWLRSPPRPID
jgi:hypothetical protein